MKIRKIIHKKVRHNKKGVNVVGDIDAVIAANIDEGGTRSHVSSRQRIVQRSGRTRKAEEKGGD
jgi:hypothetical protein